MYLLVYLLLALALASCEQDPTTVQGQVVAEYNRQPVPRASVQPQYCFIARLNKEALSVECQRGFFA